MSAQQIRSKHGVKWLGPVLSVAVACALFANCSTETRDFDSARNRNNGINDEDASTDGGGDGDAGNNFQTADGGNVVGNECANQDNGAGCGEMSGFICVSEACVEAACGDSYIDEDAGEQCDDGNAEAGDGCEPETCLFTCTTDADCNDDFPCDGEETCNTEDHTCIPGDAPDSLLQVPCVLEIVMPPAVDAGATDSGTVEAGAPVLVEAGVPVASDAGAADGGVAVDGGAAVDPTAGICKLGACVPAGCGNGILQPGEDCDDGDDDQANGCKPDCTFTCEIDDDCNDSSVCTGTETCNVADHLCVAGETLECDDAIDCTENTCDAALGCVYPLIDGDADGHASSEDFPACGDDCDDADETTYEGAAELCGDNIDNDCDDQVDESIPFWYLDCDGDGYAQEGATSEHVCEPSDPPPDCSGWTTRVPITGNYATLDCFDSNAGVNPEITAFSASSIVSKANYIYDWNCDYTHEKEPIATSVSTGAACTSGIIFEPTFTTSGSTPSDSPNGDLSMSLPAADGTDLSGGTRAGGGVVLPPYFEPCYGVSGYTGASQPACGNAATYTYCSGFGGCHRVTDGSLTQACR